MAHLNIHSLTNKWEIFKIHFMNSNLSILGLSETWLNDSLPSDLFNLSDNYTFYRNDRSWRDNNSNSIKKGGGGGLFIDSYLQSSDTNFKRLNCSSIHVESQWVSVKQTHNEMILIGNIYRHPKEHCTKYAGIRRRIYQRRLNKQHLRTYYSHLHHTVFPCNHLISTAGLSFLPHITSIPLLFGFVFVQPPLNPPLF